MEGDEWRKAEERLGIELGRAAELKMAFRRATGDIDHSFTPL